MLSGDDAACEALTSIRWVEFSKLHIYVSKFVQPNYTRRHSITQIDQLMLTLVKLRHNPSFRLLSIIRGVPKSTVIDFFWRWIDLLYAKIGFLVRMQDRDSIFKIAPPVFKEKFPRLTCIIDCFEVFIHAPKKLLARSQCYSSYKKHTTVKVFVSCNVLGAVNFLSCAYGGRASDVQIVRESGFIDPKLHLPGDQILADRGFTLHDDFAAACGAELLTPAFTRGKKQLSAREVEVSRKISSVRIHIERVIGLLKNRYTILQGTMLIHCVKRQQDELDACIVASCDKIINVCAALNNMSESIVYKV